MWFFFFKTKRFIQTRFTFAILKHRKQINSQIIQLLNNHFKICTYFSLMPLILFVGKIKVNFQKNEDFLQFKPRRNTESYVPERIEEKSVQRRERQSKYTFLVLYNLINKKKRRNIFFFYKE